MCTELDPWAPARSSCSQLLFWVLRLLPAPAWRGWPVLSLRGKTESLLAVGTGTRDPRARVRTRGAHPPTEQGPGLRSPDSSGDSCQSPWFSPLCSGCSGQPRGVERGGWCGDEVRQTHRCGSSGEGGGLHWLLPHL